MDWPRAVAADFRQAEIDFDALSRHSKPGPRYTSYPTANEFKPSFDSKDLASRLFDSNATGLPLSLYVHLPFCKSACYFCACNVIYTGKDEVKARYLQFLQKELDLLSRFFDSPAALDSGSFASALESKSLSSPTEGASSPTGASRPVVQIHFGGGTPTFFGPEQLGRVFSLLKGVFPNIDPSCEISCEIDPRHFHEEQMAVLRENGCNRVSFGIQDFNSDVQRAVNRIQSVDLVEKSVSIARKHGITSINFDLIYGLPHQSVNSFLATLKEVVSLDPDRLAVFNYAHVPWVKKTMRKIDETKLPAPSNKLLILKETIAFLVSHGYCMIGMDHFAKPNDALYLYQQAGQLRRNFQGYTTKGFSQTVGIGVTSISEGLDFYSQNHKDLKSYEAALDSGLLPVACGVVLDSEDRLRKEVIMSLMNNFMLDFSAISKAFNIDFSSHFERELEALALLEGQGLLSMDSSCLRVSPTGRLLIRNVAMVFDSYLVRNQSRQFSNTI